MLAVEVGDPREAELPAVGPLTLVDPETGARVTVDTSQRRVRERGSPPWTQSGASGSPPSCGGCASPS